MTRNRNPFFWFRAIRDLLQPPRPSETPINYRHIGFFFQYIRPLWKQGVVALGLTLIMTALGSLLPLSSKIFIDFVILNQGYEKLAKVFQWVHLGFLMPWVERIFGSPGDVIVLMLGLGLIIGVLGMLQNVMMLKFQQDVTYNIQTDLFRRVLGFPLSFLKETQVGYLMSRISNDVNMLQYFYSNAIPQLITSSLYLFFSFSILLVLHAKITLILIGLIPAWVGINLYFAPRVRALSHQNMERYAQVSRHMQEMLSGVEVIKSHVSEDREVEKFSEKIRSLFRTRLKALFISSLSNHAMKAFRLVAILILVWMSVREIRQGQMTIGDMTAMMSYVVYLSGLASTFSSIYLNMQNVFAAMARLMELFQAPREDRDALAQVNPRRLSTIKGEIRFDNVTFYYEKDRPVLKNISLTLPAGQTTILTGPSGAGKTTFIHLMIKFRTPRSGTIYLDDVDISELDTQWLRSQVGFVSQDVFLFNDTIAANIKYGLPSATDAQMMAAAKQAHIHDEIMAFAQGYATIAGERGVHLSAGQRQRIAIARAFLKNPPILILDEPTSALDAQSESAVAAALENLTQNRTTLIVTHRPEHPMGASEIIYLKSGQIEIQSLD